LKIRDVNPEDLAEVHCRIGHALWQIQGCEDVLVYFIGTVLKMPPSRARHEAMAVVDQLRTCTLGGLIAELRKAKSTGSVSEFESRVNHFLNERNWLVHHSWRENHADLFNPERIPRLFKRLEALSQEASDMRHYFCRITTAWTQEQGVSEKRIENEMARTLIERGIVQPPARGDGAKRTTP
jgi:hypothetical protein